MPIDILMPQLSPTMTEGRLAAWIVKTGDVVEAGDIIAEVETDKATMEVEASEDGVIHTIIGEAGTDIQVGTPIAVMREEDEKVAKDYKPTPKPLSGNNNSKNSGASGNASVESSSSATASPSVAPTVASSSAPNVSEMENSTTSMAVAKEHASVSPLAKKMAGQAGVDLSNVDGSGPYGRIVKRDVESAMGGGSGVITRRGDERLDNAPMRKAIAKRLTESKQQVPHFYLTASANMDALLEGRKQLNALANGAYKLTVNDFILKASAMALAKNPDANVSWYDDAIIRYGNVDISVAVAIEGGLITPIVENADKKSIIQVSQEVKSLVKQAKSGTLKPEQYTGGGFSLSNLGMFGVKEFKAIVNPPQGAILAVGAAEKRVIVDENSNMQIANIMDLSISVDHRCIDGAIGALLLKDIKFFLENPIAMTV